MRAVKIFASRLLSRLGVSTRGASSSVGSGTNSSDPSEVKSMADHSRDSEQDSRKGQHSISSENQSDANTSFVGLWKPVTAGELLVHFLCANAPCFSQPPLTPHNTLDGIPRGLPFRDFVHGCLLFHASTRLTQVAKHYRSLYIDDDGKALNAIRQFALDQMDLAPGSCKNFEDLPLRTFDCAASASRASSTPNIHEKKKVLDACKGVYACYACGKLLDPSVRDTLADNYLTYDHLWPHSLGGDSKAENLMVACRFCNVTKSDAVLWQWHLVQSLIPASALGETLLDAHCLTRHQKMALHSRAALSYARTFGTTLKDAYLAVGPRLPLITVLNPDDTADFFNLSIHDVSRFASI
jgi:hypothetical protein